MSVPLPVVAGVVICFTFLVIGVTAVGDHSRPGVVSFGALCLLFGVFSVVSGTLLATDTGLLVVWVAVLELLILGWLVFTIAYTGRGPAVSPPLLAGLAGLVSLVMLGILVAPFVPSSVRELLFPINFVFQSVVLSLGVYGLFVAVRSVFVYDDVPTGGRLIVLGFGSGVGLIAVLPVVVADTAVAAAVSMGVSGLVALVGGLAVGRYRVFASGASAGHLAREQVLDEMAVGVVIVDRTGRILDSNEAFETMFGLDRQPVGDSLAAITGPLSAGESVSLTTAEGRRDCVVTRTPLTAVDDRPIGEAYRIRDVTERRTREQRLDVLNRVLRHNLRNDLDAMDAFAEAVERTPETVDATEIGTRIGDTARTLADIGSTVERGERLLSRDTIEAAPVDVGSLAHTVADRLADEYPGTVRVETDGTTVVRTDTAIVETVLGEVVENGVEHGPGPDAVVTVRVTTIADGVEVVVRDNGPGIPEQERAVLLDGEESPLRHGSGVGLWFVNWGLSRLGGELQFREPDDDGSVVTIRIPTRS